MTTRTSPPRKTTHQRWKASGRLSTRSDSTIEEKLERLKIIQEGLATHRSTASKKPSAVNLHFPSTKLLVAISVRQTKRCNLNYLRLLPRSSRTLLRASPRTTGMRFSPVGEDEFPTTAGERKLRNRILRIPGCADSHAVSTEIPSYLAGLTLQQAKLRHGPQREKTITTIRHLDASIPTNGGSHYQRGRPLPHYKTLPASELS